MTSLVSPAAKLRPEAPRELANTLLVSEPTKMDSPFIGSPPVIVTPVTVKSAPRSTNQ